MSHQSQLIRWLERIEPELDGTIPKLPTKRWAPEHEVRLSEAFMDCHTALMDRTGANNEVSLEGARWYVDSLEQDLIAGRDDKPRRLAPYESDVFPVGPPDDDDDGEPDPRAAAEIERILSAVEWNPSAPFNPWKDSYTHGDNRYP